MSRIGKKPIPVPSGVKVSVANRTVTVQGPGGTLTLEHRPEVSVALEGEHVVVRTDRESDRVSRALWGTTRANINNMVQGVVKPYQEIMEVQGVGYTAEVQGNKLKLVVGYANPIFLEIPPGLKISVERQQVVTIQGIDKKQVGQFAADMRAIRKPEPYNAKGIKYRDEVIRRKQGKQFGS
jgi:large subunit ribosomal protein L6